MFSPAGTFSNLIFEYWTCSLVFSIYFGPIESAAQAGTCPFFMKTSLQAKKFNFILYIYIYIYLLKQNSPCILVYFNLYHMYTHIYLHAQNANDYMKALLGVLPMKYWATCRNDYMKPLLVILSYKTQKGTKINFFFF